MSIERWGEEEQDAIVTSSDRLTVDWFKGISLIINVDGVLLGFLLLMMDGIRPEYINNSTGLYVPLIDFNHSLFIIGTALFLIISLILGFIVLFRLPYVNHEGRIDRYRYLMDISLLCMIYGLFSLLGLMFAEYFPYLSIVQILLIVVTIVFCILIAFCLSRYYKTQ